jgi:hypothetical protein
VLCSAPLYVSVLHAQTWERLFLLIESLCVLRPTVLTCAVLLLASHSTATVPEIKKQRQLPDCLTHHTIVSQLSTAVQFNCIETAAAAALLLWLTHL